MTSKPSCQYKFKVSRWPGWSVCPEDGIVEHEGKLYCHTHIQLMSAPAMTDIREKVAIAILRELKKAMGFGVYKEGHWESLPEQQKQPYLSMADQILALIVDEDAELPKGLIEQAIDW